MTIKLPKIFKWRVNLIQQGYDLGWEHGYEAGMVERHNQIVDTVTEHVHGIDWLKEDMLTAREIVKVVKEHQPEKEVVGWEKQKKK